MDSIDRQIISCLIMNGRASFANIGKLVALTAPAVKRRVDRLVGSGRIRGFTAVVDPTALGWTTEAYVEVYCRGTVSPQELRSSFEHLPEVVDACTVSGPADALLHVRAEDVNHLEQAIERVREGRNVDQTKSVIVLSRLLTRESRLSENGIGRPE